MEMVGNSLGCKKVVLSENPKIEFYLGDCLEVLDTFSENFVDLVVTDPPYMISKKGNKLVRINVDRNGFKRRSAINLDFGEWDYFDSEDCYIKFTEDWFSKVVKMLKDKSWLYIFFDKQKIGIFDLLISKKYNVCSKTIFTWIKSNPVPSFRKRNWLSATEFVWVGCYGNGGVKNFLEQKQMYNYFVTPNKSIYGKTKHPTEKPESLIEKFIITSSYEGDVVLDPFMGSGTTAVCAYRLGRNFIGIEKNEKYFNMAVDRFKKVSNLLF